MDADHPDLINRELCPFSATGVRVWPSAAVLIRYLLEDDLVSGRRILELGAGTGIVGLSCALAGTPRAVVLTDRLLPPTRQVVYAPDGTNLTLEALALGLDFQKGGAPARSGLQLDILRRNVALNEEAIRRANSTDAGTTGREDHRGLGPPSRTTLPQIVVRELDFCERPESRSERVRALCSELGPFDLVVGSDITYSRDFHADLAETLVDVLVAHQAQRREESETGSGQGVEDQDHPRVFLAHELRLQGGFEALRETFGERALNVREVGASGSDDVAEVLVLECFWGGMK